MNWKRGSSTLLRGLYQYPRTLSSQNVHVEILILQFIVCGRSSIMSHLLLYRYVLEDVDRQWPNLDIDGDGYVTWDEYRNRTYGYMSGRVMWYHHHPDKFIGQICSRLWLVYKFCLPTRRPIVCAGVQDPVNTQLGGLWILPAWNVYTYRYTFYTCVDSCIRI